MRWMCCAPAAVTSTKESNYKCTGWMMMMIIWKLQRGMKQYETDLWCCWLWCVYGAQEPWMSHSLRPAGCSSVRPSCSHVRLHLQHTGYPEAGSPVRLMWHRQIYHSVQRRTQDYNIWHSISRRWSTPWHWKALNIKLVILVNFF